MKQWAASAVLLVLVTGCAADGHKFLLPAASANTVPGLAAAVKQEAARYDEAANEKAREQLSRQANEDADACVRLEPRAAACLYSSAIALGLQAKLHPIESGVQNLNDMLSNLNSAESADASYDHGGPARIQALVYLRAPTWPLGPGDPDRGLAAAKRAVELEPDYPPNQLALGEALAKTSSSKAARDAYVKARDLAQAMPPGPERDGWLREATEVLQGR